MTQVIDERVVEMKFDNKDFEKNVAESLNTLDKLKQALNIDSAKSLRDISASANQVDLSHVSNAVEEVKASFSALQIVGITALSELTKSAISLGKNLVSSVVSPIKSGGMNRALNIEQAKFQLKGLGVAWKDIEDDINYGVKDTAYGLDAAAKAASQLVASGVQLGDEMKAALRGISGVASMTSSSFEEISPIFTTVAGQGKLMTMQLRQLEARGLNAAATLGNFLGVTEEEIREMVKKGQIDFELFSTAMDDAFGSHAKEANETFTGAMSNVRAALSRIGANFATPYMENMRLVAVESIKVINQINKFLNPVYETASKIMEKAQKIITTFLKSSNAINSAHSIIVSVRNVFKNIYQLLAPIKEAFLDIFPKQEAGAVLRNITLAIERFTASISVSDKTIYNIERTFRGLFAVVDLVGTALGTAIRELKPLFGDLAKIGEDILNFTGDIGDSLVNLKDYVEESNVLGKTFRNVAFAIRFAVAIIKDSFNIIKNGLLDFKKIHIDTKDFSGVKNFFNRFKDAVKNFSGVGELLKKIFGGIATAFNDFKPVVKAVGELVSSLVGGVLQGFANAFGGNKLDSFSAFLNILSTTSAAGMMINLSNAFSQLGKSVKTMGGLSPILIAIKTGLVNTFAQVQAELKADVLLKLAKVIAIFAGSLLVLSMINPDRLMLAATAIAAILAACSVALGGINKLTTNVSGLLPLSDVLKNSFNNISNSVSQFIKMQSLAILGNMLLELSVAVGILALSLKAIGNLRPDQLVGGLGTILVLMAALYTMAEKFANKDVFKQKAIMAGASQLILLATSVRILASAVKTIGKLNYHDVIQGVGSVVVIMLAMTEMLQKVAGKSMNVGTGLAIIEMTAAINLIAKAIISLGELEEDKLLQGSIAVGAIGAALAVFLKVVSEFGNLGDMGSTGVAVVALAASIYIVAQAIEALGDLSFEQIGQGMVALGIALIAMGGGLKILSESTNAADLVTTAGSLVILGIALKLVSSSIALLAQQDPGKVVLSLLALAGAIGTFVVAATLAQPLMGALVGFAGSLALFGVSVLALGAGLLMLSSAVAVFNAIGPQFLDVLLGLAIGIGSFAVAAMVLQPVLVPMAALAGVLALVGVASLAVGAGLMMVAMGLSSIASIGTLGAVAIEAVSLALVKISASVIAFGLSVGALGMFMVQCVANLTLFGLTILASSALLVTFMGSLVASTLALTAFTAISSTAVVAVLALAAALNVLLGVIANIFPTIGYYNDGIEEMFKSTEDSLLGSCDSMMEGVRQKQPGMRDLGKFFISGFLEGLQDVPILGAIVTAGKAIANAAIDSVADTQDSHSNSQVGIQLGKWLGLGYVEGIDDTKDDVTNSAEALAKAGVDGLGSKDTEFYNTGVDSSGEYINGWADNFPSFKAVLADYKNEASDTADDVEWDLHRTMEAYNKELKLKKAYESAKDRNKTIRDRLKLKGVIELETDAIEENTEAEEENAKATGKSSKAKEEKKNVLESLKDTLESQMDIFTKFEAKTDITAEQMLENMKSNLDGFASWSARLASLTERGISKALWEKLAEMGPKGYAELNAFVNMTDEQLQQANEMYAASLAMDDAVIAQISPSYEKLGGEIPKGIAEGIRKWQEETKAAITETSEATKEAFKEDNGIASPSTVYAEYGRYLIEGLRQGIQDPSSLVFLMDTIRLVSKWNVLEVFKSILTFDEFYNIGLNCIYGLTSGLNDPDANAALDAKIEEIASKIAEISMFVLGEASPSKVMRKVGRFATEGLALGIEDAAQNVIDATELVVNGAIESYNNINSINSLIDTSIDFNPIITPMLDLSYIQSQVSELDNMLNSPEYGMNVQNGGNSSNTPQQITFTQNNYSPKSLSRYEIYKQTNRQLSQIRKVVTA